jgi:hypothetical protein
MFQQLMAEGQCKKRCFKVSSEQHMQRMQSKLSKCMFFLLRIFLVLSLSFRNNQKNTLCLGCQENF